MKRQELRRGRTLVCYCDYQCPWPIENVKWGGGGSGLRRGLSLLPNVLSVLTRPTSGANKVPF